MRVGSINEIGCHPAKGVLMKEQLFAIESVETLRTLFSIHSFNINARNQKGDTPLIHCIRNYRESLLDKVHLLLEYGADPNISDPFGVFPIQLAPNLTVVRLLVGAGARLNVSLHRLISRGCHRTLEFLLKNGMRTKSNSPNNPNKLMHNIRNIEQLRVLEKHIAPVVTKAVFTTQVGRADKVNIILQHAKKLNPAAAGVSSDS